MADNTYRLFNGLTPCTWRCHLQTVAVDQKQHLNVAGFFFFFFPKHMSRLISEQRFEGLSHPDRTGLFCLDGHGCPTLLTRTSERPELSSSLSTTVVMRGRHIDHLPHPSIKLEVEQESLTHRTISRSTNTQWQNTHTHYLRLSNLPIFTHPHTHISTMYSLHITPMH